MIFLNRNPSKAAWAESVVEEELLNKGLQPAGWRIVPTDIEALGNSAISTQPLIKQIFVFSTLHNYLNI